MTTATQGESKPEAVSSSLTTRPTSSNCSRESEVPGIRGCHGDQRSAKRWTAPAKPGPTR